MADVPASSLSTTIFDRMSRAAAAAGAINLGQGFPDLPDPPELIAAAQAALTDKSNQYPPMRGLLELRRGIADYYARTQALSFDPDREIVVTSGATEALAASILGLIEAGDEVILIQPLYDAYAPLVERAGGVPRLVALAPPDWSLSLDAVAEAIGEKTRAIILNIPNNPTGTLLDRATLEGIGVLAEAHDLFVICDEVWEAMLFDGAEHVSPMAMAQLRDRTVKIGSAGKIFSMTGWKVGWCCAAPPLADRIAASHQFLTFTTAVPLQWAVAEGLSLPEQWHAAHLDRYARARKRLIAGLEETGHIVLPSAATWFVTVDLAASGIALDDVTYCERIIDEAGVAAIPISAFYRQLPPDRYVRLCFAKRAETLDRAVEALSAFREGLP